MRPRGTGALPSLSRIAVVGGGAAGLGAIRQLLAKGVKRECIVAFEARAEVGGLW
jgi:cation diffusion facilitator CzcD-associated flavoprotein CzcO